MLNVYRAATQSLAGDEALTFHWFLRDAGWRDLFTRYNANHHVLHSLLAKASISLLGNSEFALRVPALAAGLLYLIAACRLCLRLLPGWLPFAATLAALCLNPLVLDFLSCARGYGLAVAALLWALEELIRDRAGEPFRPVRLGLWSAAAVGANLTAATGVAAIYAVLGVFRLATRRSLLPVLASFALALLLTAALLWMPLSRASWADFYAGTKTVAESFQSLIAPFAPAPSRPEWLWAAAALLTVACGAGMARGSAPQAAPVFVLLLCLAALYLGHRWMNIPLPVNRTGLYLIPLFTLSVAATWQLLPGGLAGRAGRALVATCAAAVLILYGTHLRVDRYFVWVQDAASRRALQTVRRLAEERKLALPVRVASTIWLYPSLEYYALRDPGWFVNRTVRKGCEPYPFYFAFPPTGPQDPPGEVAARYEFYLLWIPDISHLSSCGLTVVESYPEAGTVLAVPAGPR